MKTFDFIIQTLLISLAVMCIALGKDAGIGIAFVQFFMGCWQLMSAIIASVKRSKSQYEKRIVKVYWSLVAVYAVTGIAVFFMKDELIGFIWFFSAWSIALFYYVFTINSAFKLKEERSSFLDIAN